MNKTIIHLALSLLVSSSIIGCTSNKQNSACSEQTEITTGKSTKADVLRIFGTPQNKEIDGGTERWIYSSKGKPSIQTAWVRTPVKKEMRNLPNIKVTEEIRGEGTNQVQKVIITPENMEEEVMHQRIVTFDGDTVSNLTFTIGN